MSEEILIYVLKVNLILAVSWLVYRLFFYGMTYFQANRLYLLGSMLAAVFIPLLPLPGHYSEVASFALPVSAEMVQVAPVEPQTSNFSWPIVIHAVWLVGLSFLLLRFIFQLGSLLRLWYTTQPAVWRQFRYRKLSGNDQPFSFLGFIFVNPVPYQESELVYIFQHESVHARQGHTFDILLAELIKIACWWNPISYWLKHDVQANLEFIADQAVLQKGNAKKAYQLSLLKVLKQQPYQTLSTSFSFFKLKPRIKMMNVKQSARAAKLRYLLVLPLLFGFTVSCADEQEEMFEVPPPPPAPQFMALDGIDYADETIGFFVDGEEIAAQEFESLYKEGFHRVEYCENADGTKTFKAYTRAADEQSSAKEIAVYIVDGKQISAQEAKKIAPSEIDSITVLKGEKAIEKYGEMGKDGVIEITLKN